MRRLEGKVAIVTGGAGGIGAATARLFCEEGAAVALVDRPDAPLDAVLDAVRRAVPDARLLPVPVDLAGEAAAREAVDATRSAFGALDVLVNNAGIRAYEPLAEARADTWERILAVNLLSYAFMAREALRSLRARRGTIVNVSSQHAVHPRAGMGQYDATKAAIVSMTRTLAWEEAEHGVRVNAVCPGLTLTPFHVRRAAPSGRGEADLRAERVDNNLLRRWADAREIAYPILWLASDEASFVNAAVLMADGGSR